MELTLGQILGLQKREHMLSRRILAIDPGETTGVALMSGPTLAQASQVAGPLWGQVNSIRFICQPIKPDIVIIEAYRVFPWRLQQHTWSSLFTARLIGALEFVCADIGIDLTINQAPGDAKAFSTDEKLRAWGYWQPNKKHANDAIRHAVYYLVFGKELQDSVRSKQA